MNDMTAVIAPKSDQINADDFIAGPRTVRIAGVSVKPDTEQPVSIAIDGDRKVYRPCKSMSRVLVAAWGPDTSKYVGRSLTLYRDPKVKWGGLEVGGIRIGEMSHIAEPLKMVLAESKAVRKPFTVKPLRPSEAASPAATGDAPQQDAGTEAASNGEEPSARVLAWLAEFEAKVALAHDRGDLAEIQSAAAKALLKLGKEYPDLRGRPADAVRAKLAEFDAEPTDTSGGYDDGDGVAA